MLPQPGLQLGIYKLTVRLGAGGMGEVWKAEDTRLHRNVAIKLLPQAMTGDEESRARLLREARTAGQLSHPNIATIHGIELDGDTPYLVMEYVEGETLTRAIAARRLSTPQIADVGRAIADALAEAHSKGIVHRDIKPDNIVLSGNRVKVLDFGIAKRFGDGAQVPAGEFVTEAGVVLGTVSYMSPEQATGRPLDGRTDIFALGVMLYQALAGQLPFRGSTNLETLKQILKSEPPDLREVAPNVPRELAGIVSRCLRKKPDERFQDAGEVASELARVASPGFVPAPSPAPAVTPDRTADPVARVPAPGAAANRAAEPDVASPKAAVTTRRAKLTNTQWAIAGASFVIVLAVAGGFAAVRVLGQRAEPAPPAPIATPASGEPTPSGAPAPAAAPALETALPATATTESPRTPKASTPQPVAKPVAAAAAPATAAETASQPDPLADAPALAATPGDEYRAAIELLEASGWHYLDAAGRRTANAGEAERLLARALRSDPGNDSAKLYLAVTRLFGGQFEAASTALFPLMGTGSKITESERVIASYAYSLSGALASGADTAPFEASLQENMNYLSGNAELVAFAEDARRLIARRAK